MIKYFFNSKLYRNWQCFFSRCFEDTLQRCWRGKNLQKLILWTPCAFFSQPLTFSPLLISPCTCLQSTRAKRRKIFNEIFTHQSKFAQGIFQPSFLLTDLFFSYSAVKQQSLDSLGSLWPIECIPSWRALVVLCAISASCIFFIETASLRLYQCRCIQLRVCSWSVMGSRSIWVIVSLK